MIKQTVTIQAKFYVPRLNLQQQVAYPTSQLADNKLEQTDK